MSTIDLFNFNSVLKYYPNESSDREGRIVISPLQGTVGHTLGNMFRRTMLSCLDGYAITQVVLPKEVKHEFGSLDGVVQDFQDILFNLRALRFKSVGRVKKEEEVVINVGEGKCFTGRDLGCFLNHFEVVNDDLILFEKEDFVFFSFTIKVEKGRGFVHVDEMETDNSIMGLVYLPAFFCPVIHVKLSVEKVLFGKKRKINGDKLTMDITTDGTIDVKKAFDKSSAILIKFLTSIMPEGHPLPEDGDSGVKKDPSEEMVYNRLMEAPLSTWSELGAKLTTLLGDHGISTLGELSKRGATEVFGISGLGRTMFNSLEKLLQRYGLCWKDMPLFSIETVKRGSQKKDKEKRAGKKVKVEVNKADKGGEEK